MSSHFGLAVCQCTHQPFSCHYLSSALSSAYFLKWPILQKNMDPSQKGSSLLRVQSLLP